MSTALAEQPKSPDEKPGYLTTEFWLSLLAMILGSVMASGVLVDGGLAAQIIGGAIVILGKLGYTASRTSVKNTAITGRAVGGKVLEFPTGRVLETGGLGTSPSDPP